MVLGMDIFFLLNQPLWRNPGRWQRPQVPLTRRAFGEVENPCKPQPLQVVFFCCPGWEKNTLHHVTSSNPGPDNLFKHSCWYIIWNHMFHIYSEILPGIYSDILFWQKIRRSFWHKPRHSIWHSIWIYLAYYTLTFYLIFSGNLSEILNILWHFIWHSFSHSQACTRVVRHIFIHFIWHYFVLSIWHRFWILI